MTSRIAIGNGKFCYSGPNCKIHGTRQVEQARTLMLRAVNSVASATTFSEIETAKMKLEDANRLYDATNEGQALLKDLMVDADALERAGLQKRLEDSKTFAEKFEAEQKANIIQAEEGLVSFEIDENHTYDVPTYSTPDDGSMYAPTVGSKYAGYQNVTEVAKKLRNDFKEAQAKGYLPSSLKISVVGDKYSGGQALNITVQNVKDSDVYDPADGFRFNIKGKKLQQRMKTIADAYNSQISYAQVDYSNSLYYSRVTIEDESSRQTRLHEVRAAKKQRDEKPAREKFISSYRADASAALDNVEFTHVDGNRSVGRLKDTSVYVFKSTVMGRTKVMAFDLSHMNSDAANPLERLVLQNGLSSSVLARRNILKPARRTRR